MRKKIFCASFFFLLCGLPGFSQEWTRLGAREVDHRSERDTIPVSSDQIFTKIKLHIKGNDVRFFDMDIHFKNGDVQDVKIDQHIKMGGQTRVIDLAGNKRFITKVVFRYKTQGVRKRKATVVLWGRS